MFARGPFVQLKAKSVAEFTRTFENEITPLLRRQEGFQDEITLVAPCGSEAMGISLWDKEENADACNRRTYPEVLKALAKVVEEPPLVGIFEASNSTFHKIAARVTA